MPDQAVDKNRSTTAHGDPKNIEKRHQEPQSDSTSPSKHTPHDAKYSPTQSQDMKKTLHKQTFENRFINPERLKATLDKLFGPKNYSVRYQRGCWILKVPEPLTEEQIKDSYTQCT